MRVFRQQINDSSTTNTPCSEHFNRCAKGDYQVLPFYKRKTDPTAMRLVKKNNFISRKRWWNRDFETVHILFFSFLIIYTVHVYGLCIKYFWNNSYIHSYLKIVTGADYINISSKYWYGVLKTCFNYVIILLEMKTIHQTRQLRNDSQC